MPLDVLLKKSYFNMRKMIEVFAHKERLCLETRLKQKFQQRINCESHLRHASLDSPWDRTFVMGASIVME